MSTWIFFQNYGTMLQAWVVSQSAFNYKTSTLMVSFLVYLSGLDTWASTEGMRGVEGRFHSYEKLKHPNNISCYHYGEWLQTCPRIFYCSISLQKAQPVHTRQPAAQAQRSRSNAAFGRNRWGSTVGLSIFGMISLYQGAEPARPRRTRSCGFDLFPARASAAAFVLHNVSLPFTKGSPSQDYQPFNNFSHSPLSSIHKGIKKYPKFLHLWFFLPLPWSTNAREWETSWMSGPGKVIFSFTYELSKNRKQNLFQPTLYVFIFHRNIYIRMQVSYKCLSD